MAKIVSIAVALTALGACTLDEPARIDSVDFVDFEESASVVVDEQAQGLLGQTAANAREQQDAVQRLDEALHFVREFSAHLERRGVTPEELVAAGEAGDEQRVRELLGFSDAEYEAWYARFVELMTTAQVQHVDSATGSLEGWTCPQPFWSCLSERGFEILVASVLRGKGTPISIPVLLALGGVGAVGCAIAYCHWDRTDPGPPVRRP